MSYAERAYFDGDACQHCADRDEHLRLRRINRLALAAHERRKGSRGIHAYTRVAA